MATKNCQRRGDFGFGVLRPIGECGHNDQRLDSKAGLCDLHFDLPQRERLRHPIVGFSIHPSGALRSPPLDEPIVLAQTFDAIRRIR